MDTLIRTKGQSALEFLSTYTWALLIIAVLLGGFFVFIYLPSLAVPQTCSFIYAITCQGVSVNTNSMATAVNLYLVNGQQYDLTGNTIASANLSQFGSANAICSPANVIAGGIILCSVTMPSSIPVGTSVGGSIYLSSNVCLGQSITSCATTQPITYVGNFTTSVTGSLGSTNQIPSSISITGSPASAAPGSTVTITATVTIFGKPAKGAGVMFSIPTLAGASATISPTYVLTSSNGQASANLYISSCASSCPMSVNALFTSSNTVTITAT